MTLRKHPQPQPAEPRPPIQTNSPLQLPQWPPNLDQLTESLVQNLQSGDCTRYHSPLSIQLAEQIQQSLDVDFVRLVCSGTLAMELALRCCQINPGDEVILCAYDYPGNIRSINAVGATAIPVDTAELTWMIDVDQVEAAISPKTKAIIASHLYQQLADVPRLRQLADRCGLFLIEDACQAPAAIVAGRPAGSWGHLGTLSFGGSKVITAGAGGAIVTSEPRLALRIRVLADRPSDAYAISGLQASVLIPQWHELAKWNQVRHQMARLMDGQLRQQNDNVLPSSGTDDLPAYYKFAWFAQSEAQRNRQIESAANRGLPCGQGYPLLRGRARGKSKVGRLLFPNAQRAAKTTVVLDHRALVVEQQQRADVLSAISDIYGVW